MSWNYDLCTNKYHDGFIPEMLNDLIQRFQIRTGIQKFWDINSYRVLFRQSDVHLLSERRSQPTRSCSLYCNIKINYDFAVVLFQNAFELSKTVERFGFEAGWLLRKYWTFKNKFFLFENWKSTQMFGHVFGIDFLKSRYLNILLADFVLC